MGVQADSSGMRWADCEAQSLLWDTGRQSAIKTPLSWRNSGVHFNFDSTAKAGMRTWLVCPDRENPEESSLESS
jgi:hypothetical protein